MSELEIRSGGVIEVDTASLRAASVLLRGIAGEADELGGMLGRAVRSLLSASGMLPPGEVHRAQAAVRDVEERAAALADALAEAALLYETVELLAQRAAAEAAGETSTVRRLEERMAEALDGHRELRVVAQRLLDEGPDRRDLATQAWGASLAAGPVSGGFVPLILPLLGMGIDMLGRGRVLAGRPLSGAREPVAVRALATSPTTAPATLAAAAARIPGGGAARVRVETYTMPAGRRQFALYVAGTQALAGADPFDVRSNVQLYGGQRSASYEAVAKALERAGARPGDVVHAFGHSQGAMIAERLAMEGTYDVRTLVSFGSPVQGEAGARTLAVDVRHTDDAIAALQGGGHAAGVGATGSFVVERTADPQAGLHDAALPAHAMAAYEQTAALVDASADPRVDALRDALSGLSAAGAAVATDYAAERISPASSAAGARPGSR